MLKTAAIFAIGVVALLGSVTAAPAIAIYSSGAGDGFGTMTCAGGTGCGAADPVFTLVPDPGWQNPALTSQPLSTWVSFNATHGTDGSGPLNNTATETAVFQYAFTLVHSAVLSFTVWADDTAGVLLDGGSLIAPRTEADLGSACVNQPVGCTPGNGAQFLNILLAAGNHSLTFNTFQLGGDNTPFGLLMAGELTPTPEPATILLLGSALTAAGVFSRRRLQKK